MNKKQGKLKNFLKGLSKPRKAFLILIGSFILLGVALLSYYFVYKKESPKPGKPIYEIITKDNYSYSNGVLTFLDEEDNAIGTYECANKNENKCYVAYESNEDNFDEIKNYDNNNYELQRRSKFYYGRYAFIYDNITKDDEKILLYDFKNETKINNYLLIKSYYNQYIDSVENNYIIVKNENNKYGVLNLEKDIPEEIIPFEYDYLGVMKSRVYENNNKLVYHNEAKWGLISFKNKILASLDLEIKGYNDKYVKTIDGNKLYNLYLYDGTLVKEGFTYIDCLEDYIATITNNKYLHVYNNDMMRLMAEPKTVKNDYYVPKNIFDEKGSLIKTARAYEISSLGNTLYVNIMAGEDKFESTYNLLDGLVSFNYDYYSYENGNIYFYKDLEKNELIGVYTCINKNNLTESSTTFNNCRVGTDSVDDSKNLSIPIYLEKYAFIYDAPSLVGEETVKIMLYNILSKETLGKYLRVYSYSKEEGMYLENAETSYVIAVNKEGKYGVLKLEKTEASKAVSFIYDDIKEEKECLMGKSSGSWSLFNYEGVPVVDGNYQLFDLSYTGYIIAVDNDDMLHLYNYEKKELINTPIELVDNITTSSYSFSYTAKFYTFIVNDVTYKYLIATGDLEAS